MTTVHHTCGHSVDHELSGERAEKWALYKRLLREICPTCKIVPSPAHHHVDPTTPAGASPEGMMIAALDRGWTPDEIAIGHRTKGRETFVCDGCGRTWPRTMAMSASMGISCPDCYDNLS